MFFMIFSVLAAVSCAPLTYTLPVEKRIQSADNVDFAGALPGVMALIHDDSADSTLMSALACGIAEGLEADLGLDSASVPVFVMHGAGIDLGDSAQRQYFHAYTGVDFLIVADSLSVGEFSVEHVQEQAYVQSQFLKQTLVRLPYSVKVQVFNVDSLPPVADLSESDVFEWSLMAESEIPELKAIEKVNSELDEYFKTIGVTMTDGLTPRWETVDVSLYVYDNAQWTEACRLAYLFEWEKAMNIWMEDAESPDTRKAACAAYNISVACEMLGMDDMAAEWKARSEKLFNFN